MIHCQTVRRAEWWDRWTRLHGSDVNGLDTDSIVGELHKHVDKVEAIVIGPDRTKR
jgi:hypothetical protein